MSATTITGDSRQRKLLAEAAEWRLLGLLFECPCTAWRGQVAALASETTDPELRGAAKHALEAASEGLYHSIFGPGGPAPPREVSYHETLQLGYLMSELAGYYDAFAYRPATAEVRDHVAVEAGFVGYLRLKEAYALACSDAEHAAVTTEAAQNFIDRHLANLAEPLAKSLRDSGVTYLALAGKALLGRVGSPRKAPAPVAGNAQLFNVLSSVEECAFDCGESEN